MIEWEFRKGLWIWDGGMWIPAHLHVGPYLASWKGLAARRLVFDENGGFVKSGNWILPDYDEKFEIETHLGTFHKVVGPDGRSVFFPDFESWKYSAPKETFQGYGYCYAGMWRIGNTDWEVQKIGD